MAYKGKNPNGQRPGNNNNSNGAGAKNGGKYQGGKQPCGICGLNNHATADCFKNKNNKSPNPKTRDSAKPPSRPCSNCGGQHYDNQCPNSSSNSGTQPTKTKKEVKTPSRACKHCQQMGHFDSSCPTLTTLTTTTTAPWQNQNQPINHPCSFCGSAHQATTCPNRPQQPPKQYLQTTTEVHAHLGALISALQANPFQADAIIGQWQGTYGNQQQQAVKFQQYQQQQQQVPAFSVQPLARWHNNGENIQFGQQYEETSMTAGMQSLGFGAVPDAVDRDGDVVMDEWGYIG